MVIRHMSPIARASYMAASAFVMVISVFPLLVAISSSLKTGDRLFEPSLIPTEPTFENYRHLFSEQQFGRNLLNSLLVSGSVVALSLVLSLMAAWALGRVNFRGRGVMLMCVLAASMFPQVAVLSGMFELVRALHLYDSLGALMVSDLMLTLPTIRSKR